MRVRETTRRELGTAPWPDPHEWSKRQATKAGLAFYELANGFGAAGRPAVMVHAVSGFTNKSLRCLVAGPLGQDYSASQ